MTTVARTLVFAFAAAVLAGCATIEPTPLGAGDWVVARWQQDDPYWYPAIITSRVGDEISLQYDDGDVGVQSPRHVRRFDWRVGTRLECRYAGRAWYRGVIAGMAPDRYHIAVLYDDGDREDTDTSKCRER
jgi:hypothetical protein